MKPSARSTFIGVWTASAMLLGNAAFRAGALLVLLTVALVLLLVIHPPSQELRLGSYLPLHTALETTSVVVCALVFLISRTTLQGQPPRNMVILGAAFLGVALLDFQHFLSYAGMPEYVTPGSPSKAINFWLTARLLTAAALVTVAFWSWEQRARPGEADLWAAAVLGLVMLVSWLFLYRPEWVPPTFITGQGLTPLKINFEYLIIVLSLVAAYGFYRQSLASEPSVPLRHDPVALMTACIITALAEICFTVYTDVNGFFNVLGHIYKLAAVWFIYRGLVALNLGEISATLQNLDDRFHKVIDGSMHGVVIQQDGRIVYANSAMSQMLGFSKLEDLTGLSTIDDFIAEEERSLLRARLASIYAGEQVEPHPGWRGYRNDGTEIWVSSTAQLTEWKGRPAAVSFYSDITERKQAEAKIQERDAFNTAVIQTLPASIAVLDERGVILNVNDTWLAFGEANGCNADNPTPGTGMNYLDACRRAAATGDELAGAALEGISSVLEQRTSEFQLEYPCHSPTTKRWFVLLARPVIGPSACAVVSHAEITETKLAAELLEARVAERTQELQDEIHQREVAQAALSEAQRMEAFGQLAGGVAHDFNNLLTIVSGNNELLEMRLKDDKQLELLGRSTAAAEMGARLTARLLAFARQGKLAPRVINCNDQISGMTELLHRSIGENIRLRTDLEAHLWPVSVDPSEIENAVLNFAINARDAMPNGGELVVTTANVMIDPDEPVTKLGISGGAHVKMSVIDNGSGMTPEVLSRATEPFFTTKPPGKGTGLGLAAIYGAIRQSRGALSIESTVGQGTTVSIYLPRTTAEAKSQEKKATGATDAAATDQTILVVEDNPEVRDLSVRRLEALGYRVMEADGGPSAVKILETMDGIDLVFSDVVMAGGMSGYDLTRWLRDHRPALKILLSSGFSDQASDQADADLLHIKLLAKPYKQRELAEAVRDVLAD